MLKVVKTAKVLVYIRVQHEKAATFFRAVLKFCSTNRLFIYIRASLEIKLGKTGEWTTKGKLFVLLWFRESLQQLAHQ